jgi:hypothetical protein
LETYKERKPLDDKNVFLDRLIKANPNAFMEAMNMFTDGVKDIFLEGAERYGWLDNHEMGKVKKIAQKMLMRGQSIEEVSETTELPTDTVLSIANQLKRIPVAH